MVRCFADRPGGVDQILRDAATANPSGEALIDEGRHITYAELDRAANEVAAGLIANGINPGDRVALLLNNCAEFAFLFFGAMRAGAVAVPLNTREQKPELEFALGNCGAKALVHDAGLEDRIPDAAALPELRHRFAVGGDVENAEPFVKLLKAGAQPEVLTEQEAPAAILYTSGTTGKPKGAILTQLSLVISAMHYETCWKLSSDDRALMAVAATHVTGLDAFLLAMVRVKGATIILRNFKAANFLELAAKERMTYTLMVPAMYHLCLLQPDISGYDLSAWRVGGYGGSPMPAATIKTLAEKLPNLQLVNAYGSTETTSPSTLTPPGEGALKADTVGRPVPCCEIRIMDDDGCEVPPGETGEVWIKGGHVAPGYWSNSEATKTSFISGFWKSGDIGTMTADGYLQILDRKKDMINRGGFKVYSAEVENVLAYHSKVGEVAVVGDPDPVLTERVHAYILPKDRSLTADDVKAYCAERLSDYKVPDFVTFLDQPLPRNANGKVLKRALKAG
ncbi:MAG: class I adenylate-forming enzyme family protein [Rhodospirillaceae bacterium]